MSSMLDRLRRLQSLRETRPRDAEDPAVERPAAPTLARTRSRFPVEQAAPGEEIANTAGACYVSAFAYPLALQRGAGPLGALLDLQPKTLAPFHPNFGLDGIEAFSNAAFIDTETTGLGGGAGVYCFMVGVGTFEALDAPPDQGPLPLAGAVATAEHTPPERDAPTHFVVRQYFMRSPAEEQALLTALSRQLERHDIAVTFNGRSFDLPLLRNRIRYNLRFLPDFARGVPLLHERAPHLDLLMPARRLWKRRLQSCRLANLEQKVLEFVRTEDDVPGRLIPQLYIDYLRSGDARPLQRVFYHNREDIVSMVALADHLTRAFGSQTDSAQEVELPAADWIALGISYDSQGRNDLAESAYRRALEFTADPHDRAELFARLARLMKRQGRWQEAADAWQAWLSSTPGVDPTPFVELAKYCEWQLGDYDQAEMWAAWALYNLQQQDGRLAWARTISELEHRLNRIRRKKGTATP